MSEFGGLRKHEKTQHALTSGRMLRLLIVATIRKEQDLDQSINQDLINQDLDQSINQDLINQDLDRERSCCPWQSGFGGWWKHEQTQQALY